MSAATDYIQLTHAASEIDGTIEEVYAARGSYGNLSLKIASKQDELSQSQLSAVNSGITAEKLTADEAALAEVVDNGAKNYSPVSSGQITSASGGFPISSQISLPKGIYIVSFHFSGAATRGTLQLRSGSTTIDSTSFDMMSSTSAQITCTTDTITNFNIYANGTAAISDLMFCTLADWNVSQKYMPYCPTMQEMYQMILALQNGTRSAPALAKSAEPEETEPETGEEEMR